MDASDYILAALVLLLVAIALVAAIPVLLAKEKK